jgi:Spy/CpxP family protein refolding chaperone
MKTHEPSRTGVWQNIMLTLAIAALIVTPIIFGGCQSSDSSTDGLGLASSADVQGVEPLTLGAVTAKVALTSAQESRMTTALQTYNQECETRRAARSEGNRRAAQAMGGGESPLMNLIEECSDFLEPDQIVALATVISKQRASARKQRAGRTDRPGRGMRGEGKGHGFRGQMLDSLTVQLDLTEEQVQAIRELHESTREDFQMNREGTQQRGRRGFSKGEGPGYFHEQMREELAKILTEAQLQKLDDLQEARRSERQGRMQELVPERMENRVDFLVKVLKLDGDQKSQLEAILNAAQEERQQIHESIADGTLDREEIREQMPQLREQTESEIRDLLTDEQTVLFDALQDLLPHGARRGPRPL